jgi:hypothetical protein
VVISHFFPTDPPTFYKVPFGMDDKPGLQRLPGAAGFEVIEATRLVYLARAV